MSTEYRAALDAAVREYETLVGERARVDARVAQLAQTIGSLMRLCNLRPTVSWGLTDAVRAVLQAAGHPLTAVEVRDQLAAMGFDVSRYSNDLAAIHTVLKRLTRSGQAGFVPRPHDKPGYRWRQPVQVLAVRRDELPAPLARDPLRRSKGKKR